MTQEEKAKAYDEALERAKDIKNGPCPRDESIATADYIFPELRESEDERIRLISLVKNCYENGGYALSLDEYKSLTAWLEKQKEQNGEDEESTDFTIYHPLKNGKGEYECIPYSFYGSLTSFSEDKDVIDFLRTCFYTEEECNEWIEQQKEQKPAVTHGETYHADTLGTQQVIAGKMPQKPAEWSEEDELMRTAVIQTLERFDGRGTTGMQIDWLKSLRPQPKAELTLLDENIIKAAVAFVEQNDHFNCWGGIDKHTVIKALRSLKPHWKPSGEQMDALLNTSHPDDPYYNGLKSLYEHLKKLMED